MYVVWVGKHSGGQNWALFWLGRMSFIFFKNLSNMSSTFLFSSNYTETKFTVNLFKAQIP